MNIKKFAYRIYKKYQHNAIVSTSVSFAYTRLFSCPSKVIPELSCTDESLPAIAFVCDEMTWRDYAPECGAVFVAPYNWKKVFIKYSPSLFFCESAWSGIDDFKNSWRGRIYKSEKVAYNNRKELFSVLSYCDKNNIPTVFWNKEDPAFFNSKQYNFVDTAMKFDIILTTAEECVPKYNALGHGRVYLWRFGFSPLIFYPPPKEGGRENTAVFAGSWYGDQPQRCKDMEALFELALSNGIELIIYDRYSGSDNPAHQFPAKYRPFIRPAVPFRQLGEIYRKSSYVLNINTVTDSETMFARRVYEAMACGCIIISNPAKGLSAYKDKIWMPGEDFDRGNIPGIREAMIGHVFNNHTCRHRMDELVRIAKEGK